MNEVQWEVLKLLWNGFIHLSAIGFWVMVASFLRYYRRGQREKDD